MKTFLTPPSLDDLIRLLRAWRFWVLGAIVGGLLGLAVYYISPPEYRTRATVVVSFNMEKAWVNKPDNELFYYLERESRKVADVAWADATLQQVADQTGFSIAVLRSGKLELSQPQDGGWHFYANDPSAQTSTALSAAWAEAFTTQIRAGIQTAIALDATRKALETDPGNAKLMAAVQDLEAGSLAITPELQVSLAQVKDLPSARRSSPGTYVMAGAVLLWALAGMTILLMGNWKRE
jgi:hypothetical protein